MSSVFCVVYNGFVGAAPAEIDKNLEIVHF